MTLKEREELTEWFVIRILEYEKRPDGFWLNDGADNRIEFKDPRVAFPYLWTTGPPLENMITAATIKLGFEEVRIQHVRNDEGDFFFRASCDGWKTWGESINAGTAALMALKAAVELKEREFSHQVTHQVIGKNTQNQPS